MGRYGEQATRAEHLEWCKKRALKYLPGDTSQAFASMMSDMRKHTETAEHIAIELGAKLLFSGHLNDPQKMEKFINDFN